MQFAQQVVSSCTSCCTVLQGEHIPSRALLCGCEITSMLWKRHNAAVGSASDPTSDLVVAMPSGHTQPCAFHSTTACNGVCDVPLYNSRGGRWCRIFQSQMPPSEQHRFRRLHGKTCCALHAPSLLLLKVRAHLLFQQTPCRPLKRPICSSQGMPSCKFACSGSVVIAHGMCRQSSHQGWMQQ